MIGRPVAAAGGAAALMVVMVVTLFGGVAGPAVSASSAAVTGEVCVTIAAGGGTGGMGAARAGPGPSGVGLPPAALDNAATIVSVADASGVGDAAAVIAVMVAYTESGLDDGAINGDHIGLFQQSPSWGTTTERLDPATATGLFLRRLESVAGWQQMAPWVAAQAVQVSQFDGTPAASNGYSSVVGGNYQANLAAGQAIVAGVDTQATGAGCGQQSAAIPAQPGGGVPPGYVIPPGATGAEAVAVTFALSKVGGPYVWGGDGPVGYDCSGLVTAAWAAAGYAIPRTSQTELTAGSPAGPDSLSPGDLVLVPGSDGTLAQPGHVAMYIGYGLVVAAADTTVGIIVQTYASLVSGGLSAIRHIA